MPDIPKLFTALAEWSAVLVFVLNLEKRFSRTVTVVLMAALFVVIGVIQVYLGAVSVFGDPSDGQWLLGMLLVMILMALCICGCCRICLPDAVLCWAMAFLWAEFLAALEWQIYAMVSGGLSDPEVLPEGAYPFGMTVWSNVFMAVFYLIGYVLFWMMEHRILAGGADFGMGRADLISCFLIVVVIFGLSNISYVFPNTPLSAQNATQMFYIRTLVDFVGVLILITQQTRLKEAALRSELANTNLLMQKQFEQYQFSKSNMDRLNRKYHDMKHQIEAIRAESDSERREGYLKELESGIELYDSMYKTGNAVLDTVLNGKSLLCVQTGIQFSCVADGTLLDFMDTMDLCSIFGNALDNAIESEQKVPERAKRIIRTAVYEQTGFVIIRFENYCEQQFTQEEAKGLRLPATSKQDKESHGYGLKSIRLAAEKYGGTVAVTAEDSWFYVRILIPAPDAAS